MDRQAHKKEQARKRKALFKQRNKCYQFSLAKNAAFAFEKRAFEKGYRPFTYLRKLIDADVHGSGFVMPNHTELVELGRAITSIGKNINQLTRYVHTHRELTMEDVRRYQQLLRELQEVIHQSLATPPHIISVLSTHLERYPQDRKHIEEFLRDN